MIARSCGCAVARRPPRHVKSQVRVDFLASCFLTDHLPAMVSASLLLAALGAAAAATALPAGLTARADSSSASSANTTVRVVDTALGKVQGMVSPFRDGAAHVYKGIPYAAPRKWLGPHQAWRFRRPVRAHVTDLPNLSIVASCCLVLTFVARSPVAHSHCQFN